MTPMQHRASGAIEPQVKTRLPREAGFFIIARRRFGRLDVPAVSPPSRTAPARDP